MAQKKTVFSWIISGSASMRPYDTDKAHISLCIAEYDNVLLRKFWEDEEIPQKLPLRKEEEQYKGHFVSTHSRTAESRYTVRLPFKTGPPIDIGDSLQIATTLHTRMESRLKSKP
jgi:hypothetical protein